MCTVRIVRNVLLGFLPLLALAMTGAGCGGTEDPAPTSSPLVRPHEGQFVLDIVEYNTYIPDSIQIDVLNGGPGDANLFRGDDPADATASADLPADGPGRYIDWEDLAGDMKNHQFMDTDDDVMGRDKSAFPSSNECVGPANVLAKMDLTYVGVASNNEFVYLAVQRAANNGDAGYYWVFTRKPPRMMTGATPCAVAQQRLVYDVSGPDPATGAAGDVLVAGHFKPSAEPLLKVFMATRDATVTAVEAVNYKSDLWAPNNEMATVAVNMTKTAPGVWGFKGVKTMVGAHAAPEVFAEAGVPLRVFTGGTACGAIYYGSVITRSSGAGGTSPDLKDLAGPKRFNFGSIKVAARLEPTCTQEVHFAAAAQLGNGDPIVDPECHWTFEDGATADTCTGTHLFATAGLKGGTVTVTDRATRCAGDHTPDKVGAWPALDAMPALTGTCNARFGYAAPVTGGSPAGVRYEWTFGGAGPVVPPTSDQPNGEVVITVGGDYHAGLTVTDLRTDGPICAHTPPRATTKAFLPLGVDLRDEGVPQCTSDAVTFVATPRDGDGNYGYAWSVPGCAGATCVVDPPDDQFCPAPIPVNVTLTDGSGMCVPAPSPTRTYTKVTTITVTP